MTGIDENVVFLLKGDSLEDFSGNKVAISLTNMTTAQIEDENNKIDIKCINFNTPGFLKFSIDPGFLASQFTIDWWEKDENTGAGLSSVLNNVVGSSGGNSIGIISNGPGKRNHINLSYNGSSFIVSNYEFGEDKIGEWVHRAVVYDGASYKFYQNGVLYTTLEDARAVYQKGNFQIGRWRTTAKALNKKVYNFRISKCIRWTKDFKPRIMVYGEIDKDQSNGEKLGEDATLYDIAEKLEEVATKIKENGSGTGLELEDTSENELFYDKLIPVFKMDIGSPNNTTLHIDTISKYNRIQGKATSVEYSGFGVSASDIYTTGKVYIDYNWAPKEKGAIVYKFLGDIANMPNKYGCLFRADSDGPSLFYEKSSGVYRFKMYAGLYINLNPEDIHRKTLVLTWSHEYRECSVYADGALIAKKEYDPSLVLLNKTIHINDNRQDKEGRTPYIIAHNIFRFECYDSYFGEKEAMEVFLNEGNN